MGIKLIYGNNGAGKSLYSENNKKTSIVLNSSISNWYNETEKEISEFDYETKELNEEIEKSSKSLLSAKSSLSTIKGFQSSKFKKFLQDIKFSKKNEWDKYMTTPSINKNIETSIPKLIDLHKFISDHKDKLKNISKENSELIFILSLLSNYNKEIDENKNEYIDEFSQEVNRDLMLILVKIKNKLLLSEVEHDIFKDIELNDLKRLFLNLDEISKLSEELTNEIKQLVIESKEYKNIKSLEKIIEEKKETSIKFVEGNGYKLIKDGYAIKIDLGKEIFSEGQKAAKVLEIIIKSLESTKKKVILDDFFEKLDVENQEKATYAIINSGKEIEILTHDSHTVEIIQNISKLSGNSISENKVEDRGEIKPLDLTTTFMSLKGKIWNNDKEESENSIVHIFSKIFGRYIAKAGSLTGSDLKRFKTNENSESYRFSSNNILHYNEEINFEDIEKKFSLKFDKNVNSIEILEFLITKIENEPNKKESKYGISYKKIINHIKEVLKFLELEKSYFDYIKNENEIMEENKWNAKKFYGKFWENETSVKLPEEICKMDRIMLIHKLDNSLAKISL